MRCVICDSIKTAVLLFWDNGKGSNWDRSIVMDNKNNRQLWLTLVLFSIYLLVMVWIILFKGQFSLADLPEIRNLNLIPFGEMQIVNGKPNFGEVWQNCLIFLPFGLYLGMLSFGKSKKTANFADCRCQLAVGNYAVFAGGGCLRHYGFFG